MTDTAYNPPSTDPADHDSLAGVLRAFMEKTLQNVDDFLPARVLSFDPATNRVRVQPQVLMGTTDGQRLSRAPIASLPVFRIGAGGGMLSFPIKEGDLGWIKASDRDLSLFLQSPGQEAWPNTRRMHSFQDAIFFPDAMMRANPTGDDADRIVMAWDDGSRVVIGQGMVEVHGVSSVKVVAPAIGLEGAVTVTGTITSTGAASFAGGVTGASGIVLETHRHLGVTTGAGTSQGPTP